MVSITVCWLFLLICATYDSVNGNVFGDDGIFPCRCAGNDTCDKQTGECPATGCADGWFGPGCQIGDVMKDAERIFQSTDNGSHIAQLAIDGNYSTFSKTHSMRMPQWGALLRDKYVINSIIVYNNERCISNENSCPKLSGYRLVIKNRTTQKSENCMKIPDSFIYDKTFTCFRPLVGDNVVLKYIHFEKEKIEIAEIEAIGYKYIPIDTCPTNRTKKIGCLTDCRCKNPIEICDYYGRCNSGCRDHYTGYSCLEELRVRHAPVVRNIAQTTAIIEWEPYIGSMIDSVNGSILEPMNYTVRVNGSEYKGVQSPHQITDLRPNRIYQVNVTVNATLQSGLIKQGTYSPNIHFKTQCEESRQPDIISTSDLGRRKKDKKIIVLFSWRDVFVCDEKVKSYRVKWRYIGDIADEVKKVYANNTKLALKPMKNYTIQVQIIRKPRIIEGAQYFYQINGTAKIYGPKSHWKLIASISGCLMMAMIIFIVLGVVCGKRESRVDAVSRSDETTEQDTGIELISRTVSCEDGTPIHSLLNYVKLHARKDNQLFKEEFNNFQRVYGVVSAVANENPDKNRYPTVVPYEGNRVVLKDTSEYINASRIQGFKQGDHFIVCQGPLPSTVNDMWRMIWQENCQLIIMLTDLTEGVPPQDMCYQYWPSEGSHTYGDVTVTWFNTKIQNDLTTYVLKVDKDGNCRQVELKQLHRWSENEVPNRSCSVVKLIRSIQPYLAKAPIVVHCNSGAGRSGTFIALDMLLKQASRTERVDVGGTITKLREQRPEMVQTLEQYVFLHLALLEEYVVKDCAIPTDQFLKEYQKITTAGTTKDSVDSKLQDQFQIIDLMRPVSNREKCAVALNPMNSFKNRSPLILPADCHRVPLVAALQTQTDDRSDYINATFVRTPILQGNDAIIVTQMPMNETVSDFWRMIKDRSCNCIVMLNQLVEGQSDPYWPTSGQVESYGDIQIAVSIQTEVEKGIVVRDIQLSSNISGAQDIL
ncbi:receptor-type tyrosine-protein phosphatase alpha-like isoform X2 [Tubulanus polymorphus]|uniref:receptor-type tyrosine-protein phosphatase alpha-like isoform X2 n=1 Tax=Tubulanus polymorphus TaxID=672921 RepID=UPI003DA6013E